MSKESKRRQECLEIDCKHYELHCMSFHGRDCIKQGGRKIPLFRSLGDKAKEGATH
jgi:hypothetical protein